MSEAHQPSQEGTNGRDHLVGKTMARYETFTMHLPDLKSVNTLKFYLDLLRKSGPLGSNTGQVVGDTSHINSLAWFCPSTAMIGLPILGKTTQSKAPRLPDWFVGNLVLYLGFVSSRYFHLDLWNDDPSKRLSTTDRKKRVFLIRP